MDFTEYIKPELLILIPVLYIIGMAAKKTSLIANKLIPLIVGTIGILLSVIYVLATTTPVSYTHLVLPLGRFRILCANRWHKYLQVLLLQ